MKERGAYERAKGKLLGDQEICSENLRLFQQFFDYLEHKLKRQNGLTTLDAGCYKTLYGYISRFRNVNRWFENKPWRDLTRDDIQRVYDGLEDGTIVTVKGTPYADRAGYYRKILKSKPFKMVGKDEIVRSVIEFTTREEKTVRFVTEGAFRKLIAGASSARHALLFWLSWDIGENIDSLLKLQKRDFDRVVSPSGEVEYLIRLQKNKLKRTRRARTEPTLYPETAHFADLVMATSEPHDFVFPISYGHALRIMRRTARKTGAKSEPDNNWVRWKDLRSGMACHLLRMGWTQDEVNARLGHAPHSRALDAYINYLALDRQRPKAKLRRTMRSETEQELQVSREREKLLSVRLAEQRNANKVMQEAIDQTRSEISTLKAQVLRILVVLGDTRRRQWKSRESNDTN
ncbi:MAG: hypothetical protein A49_11690 [Methyloceanibacter sp.]|nr:MAG: hypothetical protein A49_11690 [Methyloceanibacter sp.]